MSKKTVTPRQLAANRANAKQSTGPNTIQGKLTSRYNSLTHGLTATTVVLPGEDPERYDWRRQEYMDAVGPNNLLETELTDILCATQWRRERAVHHETALMLEARSVYGQQLREFYPGIAEPILDSLAFKRLADTSNSVQALDRYEQRMTSTVARTLKQLLDVRKALSSTRRPVPARAAPPMAAPASAQGPATAPAPKHKCAKRTHSHNRTLATRH